MMYLSSAKGDAVDSRDVVGGINLELELLEGLVARGERKLGWKESVLREAGEVSKRATY
jgi:hypothetical protein